MLPRVGIANTSPCARWSNVHCDPPAAGRCRDKLEHETAAAFHELARARAPHWLQESTELEVVVEEGEAHHAGGYRTSHTDADCITLVQIEPQVAITR